MKGRAGAIGAWILFGAAILGAIDTADAQRRNDRRRSEPMYSLLRIGDEVRIVQTTEVRELIRWERERYAAASDAYKKALADARRRGVEFDEGAPVRREVKVIIKSIRGKENAEVRRARYLARIKGWKRGGFAVIQIAEEYRIVSKSEVDDLRRMIQVEFERATKEYELAREASKKDQSADKPVLEPPVKPKIRVAPRTFTTEIEAKLYVEDRLERLERSERDRRRERDK